MKVLCGVDYAENDLTYNCKREALIATFSFSAIESEAALVSVMD
jgi:hypothetical protein